jgi:hypothetical protein
MTGAHVLRAEELAMLGRTPIEALLEYVIHAVSMTEGEIVLEVVFADGRYRRGYVRSGPISIEQLKTHRGDTERSRASA